jgi:hypothetical protein
MLSSIYRQHVERATVSKQKQGTIDFILFLIICFFFLEKKKKELLTSAEQLTRLVLDGLNNE